MEKQAPIWKTWHKVVLSIIALPLFLIIGSILFGQSDQDLIDELKQKPWNELSKQEKEDFIRLSLYHPSKENLEGLNRVDWDSTSIEQKENYLKAVLTSPPNDLMMMQESVKQEIKSKFNYPEEVEFIEKPSFNEYGMSIDDVQKGKFYANGTGTAKNTFGVKISFKWHTSILYTTNTHKINSVDIFE
jgi:hypothetical protein